MTKSINVSLNNSVEVDEDEFQNLLEQIEVKRAEKIYNEYENGTRTGTTFEEFKGFLNRKLDV